MGSLLLALVTFGLVFSGYLFSIRMATQKDAVRDRVMRINPGFSTDPDPNEFNPFELNNNRSPLAEKMAGLLEMLGLADIEKETPALQAKMAQAGITSVDGIIYHLFAKKLMLPFTGIVCMVLMLPHFLGGDSGVLMRLLLIIIGLAVVAISFKGADLYILNRTEKRKTRLVRSFPDALDLMLVCVESGLALDGALSRVCKELGRAHPDITEELNRTRVELTLLNDRAIALQNLANRTDLLAFKWLTSALLQSEKFGTSLSDTLRTMSEDFRLNRLMLAEQKAGRLPVIMTLPLILLLMPAFFMVILGPAFIRVSQQGGIFGGN